MTTALFGKMLGSRAVEKAVKATLIEWLPTYLAQLERNPSGDDDHPEDPLPPGTLSMPNSWVTVNEFTSDQPAGTLSVIIASQGTAEVTRRAGGVYDAWWNIAVAVIVTSTGREQARDLSDFYAIAVRSILLQEPIFGVTGMDWLGQRDDIVPADYALVGFGVQNNFLIQTQAVVTASLGPSVPDLDPADRPVLASAHIATERIAV